MGEDAGGPGQSVAEQLAAGQDSYAKVGDGPDAPPPGLYTMQLVSAEFKNKKDGGELLIMWTHVVMEGEHKGEQMNDFSKPTSKKGYPIRLMRQRINRLGWSAPDDLRELEQIIPEIDAAGPIYKGLVEHSKSDKGVFANVEVKDLIDQYGARSSGQRATASDEGTSEPAEAAATASTFASGNDVTFSNAGKDYVGVVKTVDAAGISVTVEGEEGLFVFDHPGKELTLVVAPAEPATTPDLAAAPVDDDPPSEALLAFAVGLGYDDLDGTTQKLLVEALKENHTFKAAELHDDERLLLVRNNIPVEPKPAPAKPKKPSKPKKPAKPKKSTRRK